jgi:peptidoglycan/xylan/chitin deacetylase (PgdA/CDA1 family)
MSVDHIRDLTARGHEIGCHTASHKRLPTETQRIIEEEILLSRRYLERLVGAVETFSYPYGAYDHRIVAVVKRAGFLGARSVHDGLNDDGVDPFLLKCKAITIRTTIQEVRKWIEAARQRQAWLVLMFHQIDDQGRAPSCTPEMLGAIARYLVDTRMPVITVRDGVKRLMVT